ncbi:MAG: regulatory protein RecX [Terriglobia bacterium]
MREGQSISSKSKSSPLDPFSAAIRLLARRSYSVAELRRALQRKLGKDADLDPVLARLRQLGYLDDRKFASQFASSLTRNRTFGRRRVKHELQAKLVDYRAIDAALDQAYEDVNEQQLLERALERKLRSIRPPITTRKISSLCQSLMRLGFPFDAIMKTVRARPELKSTAGDVDPA